MAERRKDVTMKEAKDGSNVNISLKASLFEFVKQNFIQDIQKDAKIIEVKNAEGVKVDSDSSGEAFLEYKMEILFKVDDFQHDIKLTAYATTSSLQLQPKGEKIELHPHLDNKYAARYY